MCVYKFVTIQTFCSTIFRGIIRSTSGCSLSVRYSPRRYKLEGKLREPNVSFMGELRLTRRRSRPAFCCQKIHVMRPLDLFSGMCAREQGIPATKMAADVSATILSPKRALKNLKQRYLFIDTFGTLKSASDMPPFLLEPCGPLGHLCCQLAKRG